VEEGRAGSIREEKGKSEFTNERKRVSFRRGGTSPFLSISEEVVFILSNSGKNTRKEEWNYNIRGSKNLRKRLKT